MTLDYTKIRYPILQLINSLTPQFKRPGSLMDRLIIQSNQISLTYISGTYIARITTYLICQIGVNWRIEFRARAPQTFVCFFLILTEASAATPINSDLLLTVLSPSLMSKVTQHIKLVLNNSQLSFCICLYLLFNQPLSTDGIHGYDGYSIILCQTSVMYCLRGRTETNTF